MRDICPACAIMKPLSPEAMRQILAETHEYLLVNALKHGGYSWSWPDGSVRGIRILRAKKSGAFKRPRFSEKNVAAPATRDELLRMVGEDLAQVFNGSRPKGGQRPGPATPKRRGAESAALPAHTPTYSGKPLVFQQVNLGVELNRPMLYFAQSFDVNGAPYAKYVGKADDHVRPLEHYQGKIARMLAGCKDKYRRVHRGLALANDRNHRCVITLVCNVPEGADILAWEAHAIKATGSFGRNDEYRLNGNRGSWKRIVGEDIPEPLRLALSQLDFRDPATCGYVAVTSTCSDAATAVKSSLNL
ncbi:hypothetical protein AWB74_08105 [Caballeronia arvi]|uniref:Uncharacterized protein n=1 Tax=Caballeronia arvi TaxID=1777135 RepID=A0A158L2F0_9BURK|nr:hypothetical protein [Caballeronia arvi]SAL87415.1 hypothetical protein AWB74_08105 [Caballeronia arvi]